MGNGLVGVGLGRRVRAVLCSVMLLAVPPSLSGCGDSTSKPKIGAVGGGAGTGGAAGAVATGGNAQAGSVGAAGSGAIAGGGFAGTETGGGGTDVGGTETGGTETGGTDTGGTDAGGAGGDNTDAGGAGGTVGEGGGDSIGGDGAGGDPNPQPECANGATETKACGLNGLGTSTRACEAGAWTAFGACEDPDVCVNADEQTRSCGLNGSGIEQRDCVQGQWSEWSSCSKVDACKNGDVDVAACGLNGQGSKQRTCTDGAWPAFGECADPDVCANGAEESYACGINGRGKVTRECEIGAWSDWGDCEDPDECRDDDDEGRLCGLNQRGFQARECQLGHWTAWSKCEDPDQCVIGKTRSEACGPSSSALLDYTCVDGKWSAGVCAFPAGACSGDVTITDQTTFDLYSKCTSIAGDLKLVPESQMRLKVEMPLLASVGGQVLLESYYLRHVSLPALKSIGTSFIVRESAGLLSVAAPQLPAIPGDLIVTGITLDSGNRSLNGFGALATVGGSLQLFNNLYLETLSLPSLQTVVGDLWIGDFEKCRGNRFKNLNGLSALKDVGGTLDIAGNVWLTDISGLSKLESVGGLRVRYNFGVSDLSAFAKLDDVPGDLMVGHLVGPTIYGFSYGVENVIESLQGLQHIAHVGGDLTIRDVNVPGLADLAALTEVEGRLALGKLGAALTVLKAPPLLDAIGGFSLSETTHLPRIDFGVSEINGDLEIADGFRLVDVQFPKLETLDGRLWIDRLEGFFDKKANVLSLPELTHAGAIELPNPGALAQLSAFPNLQSISGDLYISLNEQDIYDWKTQLVDFNQLQAVGGDITIFGNDLSVLDAFAVLTNVGGRVSLTGGVKGAPLSYNQILLGASARTFASLESADALVIGGFSSLQKCWAQDLAEQVWPGGVGAVTDFWGIPTCTP